ncbi:MAG: hypothetical protein IJ764_06645 [Bacteroidales bacterium]|nr:hypothetical protein [Bacteroidales bacterium]
MNKWLKITLISIGSLLGLFFVVVAIACWLVFTPSRLTGIVNSLSDKFIDSETHFENVDFSLFKTFPNAGIAVSDFYVVNPMDGAPSDTLLCVEQLTVGLNVMEFLRHGNIQVRQLVLNNADANIFIDADGNNNFSIFPSSEDTTEGEPFRMPEEIDIQSITICGLNCSYVDMQNVIVTDVKDLSLDLSFSLQEAKTGKGNIKLNIEHLDFCQTDDSLQTSLVATLDNFALKTSGTVTDLSLGNISIGISADSLGFSQLSQEKNELISTRLYDFNSHLKAKGDLHIVDGSVDLKLPKANLALDGSALINDALCSSQDNLLELSVPFTFNLDSMEFSTEQMTVALDQLKLLLKGVVSLSRQDRPMQMNIDYATNAISIRHFLPYVPDLYSDVLKDLSVDAKLSLDGKVDGYFSGDTLPVVTCDIMLADGDFSYAGIPMDLKQISANIAARIDASKNGLSNLNIKKIQASYRHNTISLNGRVDDLMGKMKIDAALKGNVSLDEIMPFLPDSLPLSAKGTSSIDIKVKTSMDQLTQMDIKNMKMDGGVTVSNLEVSYDSISIISPSVQVSLDLPSQHSRLKTPELADITISSSHLDVNMPASQANVILKNAYFSVGVSDVMNAMSPISAALKVSVENTEMHYDSIDVVVEDLHLAGNVTHDSAQSNIIYQWNPSLSVAFSRTSLFMPQMPEALRLASFQFDYMPGHCEIAEADIHWGLSDYHLSGTVDNLEDWLDQTKQLYAKVNLVSSYTDVDQIMDLVSGMGSDPDTLEAMRQEDHVSPDANPFIVPRDVNIDFNTNIKRCIALGNDLSNLSGSVSVRDGKVVLDQVGFACRAARMQLTGIYKSPRPNHLYLGVDFHLLDIQIDELIDMVPFVDTLFPMLASFDGQGDFHLAIETYLDAKYQPKVSTLLGSTAISGKDLVVLPGETFNTMAKYLMFNKKTENKIDSLDVEATLFRDRIDVYPFLLSIDKYQVCVSGIHSLDNACNYHLELLRSPLPLRLAIDVKGSLNKPQIGLGKVIYNDLYNPEKTDAIKTRTLEIKKMVREALESNVK